MTLIGFKATNHPQQTGKRGAKDATDDRGTDQVFFSSLSERFGGFTLDVAAAEHNAKCDRFYTLEDDGIEQPWRGKVWCNPPYSDIRAWVEKAWTEFHGHLPSECDEKGESPARHQEMHWGTPHDPELIVMLLPANRVEQGWWQDLVEPYRDRYMTPLSVEFLRGRMRFDRPGWTPGPKGDRPPFGCCLLIWSSSARRTVAHSKRVDQ